MRRIFLSAVVPVFVVLNPATGFSADADIEAITRPSKDITLSFIRAGRIAKVPVREGQHVKPGQVLVQQDDAAEQAQLAHLKAQAEDTTRIKAAQAQLDQKKVDLRKIQWAAKREAATELEVEHAKLDVLIAELSLELARFQHEQDQRKYAESKLLIDRMRLTSPIAGRVERVFVEEGESVNELEDVIRIVNIDPLWIDIPVPLKQARRIRPGRAALVAFDKTGKAQAGAKVIHVASVADAASDTLNVRVELANPTARPAGERVYVSFPAPKSNTTAGKAKPEKKE